MQVHQEGNHWVIARNFRLIEPSGVSGSRSHSAARTREVYDSWTGERWWEQRASAMQFATREAAQQYLDENRERLENAP
jgi:hypothetical protein